jgi:hypothetical protein
VLAVLADATTVDDFGGPAPVSGAQLARVLQDHGRRELLLDDRIRGAAAVLASDGHVVLAACLIRDWQEYSGLTPMPEAGVAADVAAQDAGACGG